ncbi:group II intron maturase-specific domain-containing protein [Burkholderia sp. BDU5]|uniref:group II intron maturase-specific domain-containing protein n=1 Tax=Burkholderia sp. BDU5 TaxID=1385590 RepID=UPI003FA4788F
MRATECGREAWTGRQFLGDALWRGAGGRIKCAVSWKAQETFKQRIREMTRRSGGRSLPAVAERLKAYMPGWKAYFQLAQTPKVFPELDEWIRHRLRAVQLKHWRRGATMYRGMLALGASKEDARRVAANGRRWWRNSRLLMNRGEATLGSARRRALFRNWMRGFGDVSAASSGSSENRRLPDSRN